KTGTEFVHIPYKSSGESVQAVVAGQVTMTICDPPPASGPLRAGTARALAITSSQRHPSWPDVPTLAEAGVPDVEVWLWTAFFAPARTSSAIVARLRKETARVVRLPDVAAGLAKLGVAPVVRASPWADTGTPANLIDEQVAQPSDDRLIGEAGLEPPTAGEQTIELRARYLERVGAEHREQALERRAIVQQSHALQLAQVAIAKLAAIEREDHAVVAMQRLA